MCAEKAVKKSDFVIDRKCPWSNKSKIEEMGDQVLIWYLYGRLFPFPVTKQVNTPDKGGIEAKFDDVDNQTFPFDRTNLTRIFRRIISVHAGWKLYCKTSLFQAACT